MVTWEKLTTYLQFTGAALAIPAAAAGSYSVYRSFFTAEVACHNLRASILSTMDRNVPAEAKRTLLRKDVAEFEKKCADIDPDAHVIFQAAMQPERPAPAATNWEVRMGGPVAAFGLSQGGERRGWVALVRREPGKPVEQHFEGQSVSETSLPPAGTVLTALRVLPVWREPQLPGANDQTKLQGRLGAGECVKVLATRPGPGRQWAEVTPQQCP